MKMKCAKKFDDKRQCNCVSESQNNINHPLDSEWHSTKKQPIFSISYLSHLKPNDFLMLRWWLCYRLEKDFPNEHPFLSSIPNTQRNVWVESCASKKWLWTFFPVPCWRLKNFLFKSSCLVKRAINKSWMIFLNFVSVCEYQSPWRLVQREGIEREKHFFEDITRG